MIFQSDRGCRAITFYWIMRLLPIPPLIYALYAYWHWSLLIAYIFFAIFWFGCILVWLHRCSLDRLILGIELIADMDMYFVGGSNIVTACIKMDTPDDIEKFRQFVLDHFLKFRRCKSTVTRIMKHFFYREIEDKSVLNELVTIHDVEMDDDEAHQF